MNRLQLIGGAMHRDAPEVHLRSHVDIITDASDPTNGRGDAARPTTPVIHTPCKLPLSTESCNSL